MNIRLIGQQAGDYEEDVRVVTIEEHRQVIDEIENQVKIALFAIKNISGIDSIDECKEVLSQLERDLF